MNEKEFLKVLNDINRLTKLEEMKDYIHHGHTNVYDHSVMVARVSLSIAKILRLKNKKDIVIGALLHDYFLYDWHDEVKRWHGFTHSRVALNHAKKDYHLSPLSEDIIDKHMFPLTIKPPKYIGSWIVSIADKYCAVAESISSCKYKLQVSGRDL